MADFLHGVLTTMALCWRLERIDGVTMGFTGHDRDIVLGGLTYRSAPGMLPSAIVKSDGFDADNMDVAGALSDAAISAVDLETGRWDGAALSVFAVDWAIPGDVVPLVRGELGAVEIVDGQFSAELRGPTAPLEMPVVEETSPGCRAALGDKRCGVDMAALRTIARVTAIAGRTVTVDSAEPVANAYGYGTIRWISGANSGLDGAVQRSSGHVLTLYDPPVLPLRIGDRVEITQGCDKLFATCSGRFSNGENFRGEPHLPGNDLLMRYPSG